MNNQQISDRFDRLAAMMILLEDDPARIQTFQSIAGFIQDHPEQMSVLIDEDRLKDLPNIIDDTDHIILQYAKSGGATLELELAARLPEGMVELLDLPGLRLEQLQILWHQQQIMNLEQLEQACHENRLENLKGFGPRVQQKLLSALELKAKHARDFPLDLAQQVARRWLQAIRSIPSGTRSELTGQIRRVRELIQHIDILFDGHFSYLEEELPGGELKLLDQREYMEYKDASGLPVRIWTANSQRFHAELLLMTGGEAFLSQLGPDPRGHMMQHNLSARNEENTCAELGLQWIEPELRDLYAAFPIDQILIKPEDIKGVFHAHSTWSDGRNTLAEMAAATRDRGYQYLGISEHSQAAYYAHGLEVPRVRAQWERINELNQELAPFRIFKGIEADILPDGSLDYNEELLAGFDFVIASVHSHFHLDPVRQTDRIIRALQSPFTTILGHPTGRMLLAREGYAPDIPAVIEAAAAYDKIIEINTTPKRLDLDWRHLKQVRELGVKISINPDAHRVTALDTIPLGVLLARKGGLKATDVINTLDRTSMEAYLLGRKSK